MSRNRGTLESRTIQYKQYLDDLRRRLLTILDIYNEEMVWYFGRECYFWAKENGTPRHEKSYGAEIRRGWAPKTHGEEWTNAVKSVQFILGGGGADFFSTEAMENVYARWASLLLESQSRILNRSWEPRTLTNYAMRRVG